MAWRLYVASRDLAEFAIERQLPSEVSKRRNKIVYISIVAVCIVTWFVYSFFATYTIFVDSHFKDDEEVNSMFIINFCFMILLACFFTVSTVLFFKSFRAIKKVRRVSKNENNSRYIEHQHYITASLLLAILLMNVC